jgi:sigma-B regulation protein RsbU (phosphoserine phosphatase)
MSDKKNLRTFTFGLRLGQHRLQSVLKAGATLNSTRDLNEVLNSILSVSVKELEAQRGTVFLCNDDRDKLISRVVKGETIDEINIPINKGLVGATFMGKEILNVQNAYEDKRFDKTFDMETGFKTKTILSIPMINRQGEVIGVIQVLNKKVGVFDDFDEEFATILATFSAIAVENAKQLKFTIERERLEKELSLAKSIQSAFLQSEVPEFSGYQISATSRPCYQIGGDYVRTATLSENEYLALIADVSGKGIPAALITLALHSAIKILIPCETDYPDEKIAVERRTDYPVLLNSLLRSVTNGRAFVTFCSLIINNHNNRLVFGNCGHTEPIIVRSNGDIERIASSSPVLGILPKIEPKYETKKMEKGDLVCMFTDGVDEAASCSARPGEERDEFGTERLIKILKKNRSKTAEEIIGVILEEVDKFTINHRIDDDVTLIVIKKE